VGLTGNLPIPMSDVAACLAFCNENPECTAFETFATVCFLKSRCEGAFGDGGPAYRQVTPSPTAVPSPAPSPSPTPAPTSAPTPFATPILESRGSAASAFLEGGAAVTVVPSITLDARNVTLATVAITTGFRAGDMLGINGGGGGYGSYTSYSGSAGQPRFTGEYDADSGRLALTLRSGSARILDWQAALRAVQFNSTSHNPSGRRECCRSPCPMERSSAAR
jgi:hypothetical protein